MEEAIEVLENEHKKHEYPYERELVKEIYEKETVAGASWYDESLRAHVKMNTEEIELNLEIKYDDEVRNLIDAPYRAESFGTIRLEYNFK